jgi:DNA repair protein SbcC/Rad50
MRLHRLEVTAFGPFAATATVDFDALSAAGLFLLSGATGAGKTSVLDAVCFALYGAVPGERNDAKRLRSDQADAETPPRVTLEATLAGRRFRIVRSPAWSRPKKRGSGTTPQQASVVISERVDGAWVPLSTRLDETGHLVTALVGMNLTQFTQVAMLPQGRFQAFLRASSEDRHRVLQQLFRTARFEQVERWLRDRRVDLRQGSDDHDRVVAALVHRVSETADITLPDHTEDPADWSAGLVATVGERARTAARVTPDLQAAEQAARSALDKARAIADLRRRHHAAVRERDALVARDDEVAAAAAIADDAVRARAVLPLHRVARRCRATAEAAQARAQDDLELAAALLRIPAADLEPDELPSRLQQSQDQAAAVRALSPRETERSELAQRVADLDAVRATVAEGVAELRVRAEASPAELETLRERASTARAAAARVPEAAEALAQAERRLAAGRSLLALRNELVLAQLDLNHAVAGRQALTEELLTIQQARIDGMAAELAGRLAVGGSCPVCGSEHHPHPATPALDAPDAAAEKELRRRLADAEVEAVARADHANALETQAAVAEQVAGTDDVDLLEHRSVQARAALVSVEESADGLDVVVSLLTQAEGGAAATTRALMEQTARLAELDTSVAATRQRLETVDDELRRVLGDQHADVACLLAHLDEVSASLGALRDSTTTADSARQALADAGDALTQAALEAGFADTASALAAVRTDDEVTALRANIDDHSRRLAAVAAVLESPDIVAAGAGDPPDLAGLTGRHQQALEDLQAARQAEHRETTRATRLAELHERLTEAVAAWRPVRDELELVTGLASFVEGKSADNRLQMRLSAYVLGYRLSQVVAAANARLATMSDRRYSLEHTGRRGAGERRGGLSLLVRDDWSGESRDPATLSGGETFVVSLALALGLADVIMHEVGGATLDTLFVDEGFGSLDADTLDDVMDTLDSLRDGGRVVGVVSHVAEMRDRIPTQLLVTKARSGSKVHLRV